jgi:FMN phosphatase YigB (HAD superfamily)
VRPFDVVTFDCYGTLIDWETGITKAFQEAAAADGKSGRHSCRSSSAASSGTR